MVGAVVGLTPPLDNSLYDVENEGLACHCDWLGGLNRQLIHFTSSHTYSPTHNANCLTVVGCDNCVLG